MFRPRHAYRSPITNRYRGKAKGCPVFNNLNDINSTMVEHHDECLECLAKIKNRTDLYRTLADNNKPSNNVIKSLQRLSSSASNNRLKTCLQFLIIKVNEKSILTPHQQTTTTTSGTDGSISNSNSPKSNEVKEFNHHLKHIPEQTLTATATTKHYQNGKRQRLHHNQQIKQQQRQQSQKKPKQNQLASPPQDQVSSTQDQVGPAQSDHDCQTSLLMLITNQVDDDNQIQTVVLNDDNDKQPQNSPPLKDHEDLHNFSAQTQSSPSLNYASTTTTTTTTTTTNTSPSLTSETIDGVIIGNSGTNNISGSSSSSSSSGKSSSSSIDSINNNSDERRKTNGNNQIEIRHDDVVSRKRKKIHNNSEHDTSSTASWSSSYTSPPSPISTSSNSSILSGASSRNSSSSCSSSSESSSPSLSPSPSPSSSLDIINELKGPRLKLSEGKLRKITKRPILFDDYFTEHSFASTPTTSSGCSPGQHSNTTQNSDQSRSGQLLTNNVVIHTFQAPPKFVNNLKPCNLPTKPQEPSPTTTPPAPTKEMLNCAICGIKERPPNISKIYGQNSCSLCTRFFATFLKRPQQLYCAQDGDCLMTFDSRCQACWIKICLQKFDIEEEHRKIGQKYSPKLLSSPNVSLITIDTSLSR